MPWIANHDFIISISYQINNNFNLNENSHVLFIVSEEKMTFMQGIGRHLAALIKEKEETMGQSAESWLNAEATKRNSINRTGEFRY